MRVFESETAEILGRVNNPPGRVSRSAGAHGFSVVIPTLFFHCGFSFLFLISLFLLEMERKQGCVEGLKRGILAGSLLLIVFSWTLQGLAGLQDVVQRPEQLPDAP